MEKSNTPLLMPLCYKVGEVAKIMQISRSKAYELVHSEGFPRLMIGKRILIPADLFQAWLEENTITRSNQIQ